MSKSPITSHFIFFLSNISDIFQKNLFLNLRRFVPAGQEQDGGGGDQWGKKGKEREKQRPEGEERDRVHLVTRASSLPFLKKS